jgi:hypothetical protein
MWTSGDRHLSQAVAEPANRPVEARARTGRRFSGSGVVRAASQRVRAYARVDGWKSPRRRFHPPTRTSNGRPRFPVLARRLLLARLPRPPMLRAADSAATKAPPQHPKSTTVSRSSACRSNFNRSKSGAELSRGCLVFEIRGTEVVDVVTTDARLASHSEPSLEHAASLGKKHVKPPIAVGRHRYKRGSSQYALRLVHRRSFDQLRNARYAQSVRSPTNSGAQAMTRARSR